jgi:hypothetical protein
MRGHSHLFIACVIAALVSGSGTLAAPRAQGLANTTLRPADDAETLITGLIDIFAGDSGKPRGSIDRVVVKEDAGNRLVLSVTTRGLDTLQLTAEVRGQNRERQSQIQAVASPIAGAAAETALALELRDDIGEKAIDSGYVRIVAIDPRRGNQPAAARVFRLPKRWAGASAMTVRVTAKPVGAAASLGPRPDYAPPPKVLIPIGQIRGDAVVRDHRVSPRIGAVAMERTQPAAAPQAARRDPATMQVMQAQRKTKLEMTKNAPAALPNTKLVQLEQFQYGIRADDAQKGAQGPAAAPIELFEGLRAEDIGLNPALLVNVSSRVYPDKNPKSGIFYYHPRAYHLEWTPEGGHGMRILYGAATADGARGDVLMAARLQSGLDLSEVQLATDLLNAYKLRNPSVIFTALRPLPLEKDGLDVSLGAVLGQYSIPADKIAITGLSDVLGAIEVSWVTDPVTKENLQLALTQNVGVSGNVSFAVTGGALAPQIPLAIQIADRDSFGRATWSRAGYRNITPYPIRLRYLHALVIDPRNHVPYLYSWALDNVQVPPNARIEWDAARVPAWIDTEARRLWIDYGIVDTCEPCDKQVIEGITGGVTSVTASQITFHTITPLADTGGYEITAQVRSKYFDPQDRTSTQKTAVLKADNQDFTVGPIYSGKRPPDEPLFEYLLELTMPDGRSYKGTRWIPSDTLRVLVGRVQLEQSLGTLPGK